MVNKLVFDYSRLRGRIVEKFGSCSKFAEHIGKAKQDVSRKLNGITGISLKDVEIWSEALDIAVEELNTYFFTVKVLKTELE